MGMVKDEEGRGGGWRGLPSAVPHRVSFIKPRVTGQGDVEMRPTR